MTRFLPPERIYNGYIFDCDGTLADTMPLHHQAWRESLLQAGATFDFDWPLFTSRAGMSLEQTVRELSEQFQVSLDPLLIANEQRRVYGALEKSVLPISEVADFARQMSGRARLAVASGSNRVHVERTLEAIGLRDLFQVIVTPEDVTHGKPHPDLFLLAAKHLEVPPTECLVLEDAELGFEAARRAGMDYAVVR